MMGHQRWSSFMAITILVSTWTTGHIAGTPVRYSFTSHITAACPSNQTAFSEASQRMNCTGRNRYLCAPNADLSALIEFCSFTKRLPYGPYNCVTLQSNGYLNHVSCKSAFKDGCPDTIYFDDEIFKFPNCLLIDAVQKCFLADRQCKYVQRSSPRDGNGQRGSYELLRLVGLPACIPVIVLLVLIIVCYCYRDAKRDSFREEEGQLLPKETDEKEKEKLKLRKESLIEKTSWWTPYRKKVEEMPLKHLTVFYSLLFLRNNRIEFDSEGYWLSALNKVRSLFRLSDVTKERGRQITEEAFSIFPILETREISDDLLCEIFWNFFRQKKFKTGRLDYFLDDAPIETIAEFCRTHDYPMIPMERCLCLPTDYTTKFVEKLQYRILTHPTIEDQSIHKMLSKKFDIPMEVLCWGRDGIQRFIAYLNYGKEPVYHTTGMIVGCAGAGKTTLINRLQDCSLTEILKSVPTKGIEVHPAIFKVDDKQLQVNKEKIVNYFKIPQDNILSINLPIEKERTHFESIPHEDDLESNTRVTGANRDTETEGDSFLLYSRIPQTNRVSDIPDTTTQTRQELQSSLNQGKDEHRKKFIKTPSTSTESKLKPLLGTLENVAFCGERSVQYITLLDFAGQSAYYACHQIYFSARAFYILVMDMSKDLNAIVGKEVCGHSDTVFGTWKYRDFYAFWMKSIHTYSSRNAPVILVATHAENKSYQDIEDFTEEVFDILDHGLLHQHLVNDTIFTLTLPKDGTGQVESVDDIKQCIIETVEKQPYWGEDLPSSWVVFENELQKRKEKDKLKIMKIQKLHRLCERLSHHVSFHPTEMKDALRFFNDIGLILYFDSSDLGETVILDVQWFVNSFKNIITHNQDVRLTRIGTEMWKRFYQTGELDDKLLENIWKETEDCGESFLDHKDELLSYMQHLGLLARGSEETNNVHIIPCMTKRGIPINIIKKYDQEYVFSYKFDFFPNFIFWRFVVACVCSPGWVILDRDGYKCIFKDSCILRYNGVDVIIKINDNILDVQILGIQNPSVDLKIDILGKIKAILQRLTKTFHKEISFTSGCRCKATKIFDLGSARFLSENELREIKCSSSKQCSVCENESHQVAVKDLIVIFQENEEPHGYQQIGISSRGRTNLRKCHFESDDQDMEFGVDDVKHLKSIKSACLRGNKLQFDHELQQLRNEKEILLARYSDGSSLLHFACEGGNLAIVKILINEGFELCPTYNGKTVLHIASQHGHRSICDYLISTNPNLPKLLEMTDKRGGTSAHYAAEGGHVEILKYLVGKGIEPRLLTDTKRTVLHIATSNGQHDFCKYILETYSDILHLVDIHGWNALHFAAAQGRVEIFDTLVEFKLDVKAKSTKGNTVLHIACLKCQQEMCERIVRAWPDLIKEQNNLNRTPIFSAAEGGDIAIFELLRNNNADAETIAANNHTLLHVASEHSNYEICKYLVEKFPDMAKKLTNKGWNALHMLAAGTPKSEDNEIKVFDELVNHNLDIHQTTKNGSSILKLACKNMKYKLCKSMIEKHPTLLNMSNVDYLKTAKETNDKNMIELFKTYSDSV